MASATGQAFKGTSSDFSRLPKLFWVVGWLGWLRVVSGSSAIGTVIGVSKREAVDPMITMYGRLEALR
ncbi:hypothetical protein BaRGS_00033665 [Batillaria attramentaria]|uniref:Uncharacterized protein n=1 Tax=Batillaria attramentaria TaxID=370345 RepID=A0ABD0JK28_9CAEN